MPSIKERLKRSWNAFKGRDPTKPIDYDIPYYTSSYYRPDRIICNTNSIRSVVAAMYNKIAVDASLVDIRHVRINDDGTYKETIDSSLNKALGLYPNPDQTGRGLIRDTIQSMFDEGVVAIVPYEFESDPTDTQAFQILSIRVGKIVEWYPKHVRIDLYNDQTGRHEEIVMEKSLVVIIENPFYAIMNEPNSVAQRLMRTLTNLDRVNARNSSGKLDLLFQLPYQLRGDLKEEQANKRLDEIDSQLSESTHGIAFIGATEKVIQLNRPIENQLWEQAKDLKKELHEQIGFPETILNGTADEATMLNYQNQLIEPILNEIVESMMKKWLSPTAITQKQSIMYFKQPFKLITVSQFAEIANALIRNEIATANECRLILGWIPSKDEKANQLRNPNMNQPENTESFQNE